MLEEPIYLNTFDGFVGNGSMYGKVKYKVDPRFSSQFGKYSDPYNFNFQKMVNNGISKPGFYSTSELDDVIGIYNGMNSGNREIIFVKKMDGSIVFTPRYLSDDFPHPILAGGEDVVSAGTIVPLGGNEFDLTNLTGHYKVHKDDMDVIYNELRSLNKYKINTKYE